MSNGVTGPQATWRARAWAAHPELLAVGAAGLGAPPAGAVGFGSRAVARWGPVVGADLGVPHPWGVQVSAGDQLPAPADAVAALAWCHGRGSASGWWVALPSRLADSVRAQDDPGRGPAASSAEAGPWAGLAEQDRSGMYATDAATAAALDLALPAGVVLAADPTLDEVQAAYGGWMEDLPLARHLVTAADLARSDRRFLVARRDGTPVGCALVWWARGTGYLSGIGVLPHLRGRGIGRALTAAAARLAAQDADVVWMMSTPEGAALYGRMGFHLVDEVVHLGA